MTDSIAKQRQRITALASRAQQYDEYARRSRGDADHMEFELGDEKVQANLRRAADEYDKAAEICRQEARTLKVAMLEEANDR